MKQKDDIEVRRAALLKTARSAIRLKHSLEADAEIAERLPELESAFNASVNRGELPDVARTLREARLLHDA